MPAYIAPTDGQARAEAEPSLIHFYRQQAALLADSAKRAGVDGADRRASTARRLEKMTYEEALKGTVLIGSSGVGRLGSGWRSYGRSSGWTAC